MQPALKRLREMSPIRSESRSEAISRTTIARNIRRASPPALLRGVNPFRSRRHAQRSVLRLNAIPEQARLAIEPGFRIEDGAPANKRKLGCHARTQPESARTRGGRSPRQAGERFVAATIAGHGRR